MLFHNVDKFGAGFEFNSLACGNFNDFLGAGVDTFACSLFCNGECAETDEGYFVAFCELFAYGVDCGFKRSLCLNFGKSGLFCDSIDELSLVHNVKK